MRPPPPDKLCFKYKIITSLHSIFKKILATLLVAEKYYRSSHIPSPITGRKRKKKKTKAFLIFLHTNYDCSHYIKPRATRGGHLTPSNWKPICTYNILINFKAYGMSIRIAKRLLLDDLLYNTIGENLIKKKSLGRGEYRSSR